MQTMPTTSAGFCKWAKGVGLEDCARLSVKLACGEVHGPEKSMVIVSGTFWFPGYTLIGDPEIPHIAPVTLNGLVWEVHEVFAFAEPDDADAGTA